MTDGITYCNNASLSLAVAGRFDLLRAKPIFCDVECLDFLDRQWTSTCQTGKLLPQDKSNAH